MSRQLQSKVVIVTGGTSGMGAAFARRAASEGATVVIGARDAARGEATTEEIGAMGGRAFFVRTDVTREEELSRLVDFAVSEFGGLHGAFNNAGGGDNQRTLGETDAAFWHNMIEANLTSVFYSLKYEIPAIAASGGGGIVNNASTAGAVGDASMPAYTAAKHGVVGLTRSASLDSAKEGVRVNALLTGLIDTPLWRTAVAAYPEIENLFLGQLPTGRAGSEEDVAAFTAFLLSDESTFINGAALAVDGGFTAR
ncbi:SDR family NAD(P)-dependent oxidoreductase [Streptomyces sp. NPDC058665]|uniref:SDR family NAD(P)-dependent oxidoreductase n=1 Tax=Streptomyces sp. NPDC058665 TaxID=3346586 RepID=UPI00364BC82C